MTRNKVDVLSRGIHTLGFVADYRSAARRDLEGNRGSNGVGNVNLIAGTCVENSHRQLVRVLIGIKFLIMLDGELFCLTTCRAGDLVLEDWAIATDLSGADELRSRGRANGGCFCRSFCFFLEEKQRSQMSSVSSCEDGGERFA